MSTFDAESPLHKWATEKFAYLTTTGRTTGNPHRIEMWFAAENGNVYLLSGGRDTSDWVKNLQANPNVTVELGTDTFTGMAEVLAPDTPEDERARQLLVEKYTPYDSDLDDWRRRSLPIVIRFP